jgi:RNA polymerase sigma factor (sigma-70 family)
MKSLYLLGGIAAFSIVAAGAMAAQPGPAPGPQGPGGPAFEGRGPGPGQMGRQFGRRGDGVRLSPEERKKILTERFQKIDANRDGRVTFEEMRTYREAQRLERQKQAFSRLAGGKDAMTLDDFTRLGERGGMRRGGRMGPMRAVQESGDDPDGDLVVRIAAGEPAAVQAFVARKLPRMLALARRMLSDPAEAEDVAQEVFVRVWRQAKTWRPGAARFDTWMHRVALNLCYDRLRRRREDVPGDLPDRADPSHNAEQSLETRELGRRIEQALAALPERQRTAMVLHHYQELSNIEVAALMETSVEAVESLLSRGRRALKQALADLRTP